jgi:lipopolysaccharide/colanic/teichoic acid biosynthesis glycosyltransferase
MRRLNASVKRLIDVVLSLGGIIVCLPLAFGICIAIKCDSSGPILFSQPRLGQNGRRFVLYKFRKFHHLNRTAGPAITFSDDRRMTRVGRFLRRTKLDELPQFWNVLRGDMSLVGPRPETLDYADCFTNGFERVLDYKPGLFGPNQCFFRNEGKLFSQQKDPEHFYRHVLFATKARVDMSYFSNANVFLDIWWLGRGVFMLLWPDSDAEGSESMPEKAEEWMRSRTAAYGERGRPSGETV